MFGAVSRLAVTSNRFLKRLSEFSLWADYSVDPDTEKVKKKVIYYDTRQHANFWGKPRFQATKRLNVEK